MGTVADPSHSRVLVEHLGEGVDDRKAQEQSHRVELEEEGGGELSEEHG